MRNARRARLLTVAVTVLLLLLLAACEQDADDETEAEPDDDTEEAEAEADADADDYPTDTVEFTVPFAPGGGADNAQRVFNPYAEEIIGQDITVLNREGAGGTIGWAEVLEEEPDGYSMTIGAVPFNTLPVLLNPEDVDYELDDFTYACVWAVVPDVVYVDADSEWETLDDLLDDARERPGELLAGNTGAAGTDALATLMLEEEAGVEFEQVSFEGDAESLQAVQAGTIDVMFTGSSHVFAFEDELRPLAIATEERHEVFPDIPSMHELGYEVESARYRSVAGSADLPDHVIEYWEDVCEQVVDDEDFRDDMLDQAQPPQFLNHEEAMEEINNLSDRYRDIIEEHGIEDEDEG